jgi:23S rRNA pseudouridine1911/1915/1917 synthase
MAEDRRSSSSYFSFSDRRGFVPTNVSSQNPTRLIDLVAEPEDAGQRLDRWLAARISDVSRARLQALIRDGQVSGGGTIREARTPVKPGVTYTVSVPPAAPTDVAGEAILLDVVYEDDALIVIDKPAGLVVHPAAGHADGTLVNALIAHCGASLSGIGGVKRPGIVHRLDKDTSGLLVVAKTDAAHQSLAEQFKSHGLDGRLHRSYLAFVWGKLDRPKGTIEARLGRSRANRMKISVMRGETLGRAATTHYEVLETYAGSRPAGEVSLVRLTLETGRTHQIRVHLAHIGHPVLGDPIYGTGFKTRIAALKPDAEAVAKTLKRQALHAAELAFEHPITGKKLSFNSSLPLDLEMLAGALRGAPPAKRPKKR